MLNAIVKECEQNEIKFCQCGRFSKQWKSLKCLPPEKMESALAEWFMQAHESNASTDGIQLKEKALHIAA
jgi:hypothetical protein